MKRRCLKCQQLYDGGGSYCPPHRPKQKPRPNKRAGDGTPHPLRYDWAWRQQSKRLRQEHIETWGALGLPPRCPGWRHPPHYVTASQLVVDHDLGVMCRACNSRKAALWDRDGGARGSTQT